MNGRQGMSRFGCQDQNGFYTIKKGLDGIIGKVGRERRIIHSFNPFFNGNPNSEVKV